MKFALDTNLFIDSFRSTDARASLFAFFERALPVTFMSAVVMQELAAGARGAGTSRELQRSVFRPFERRGRIFAPSASAFLRSGELLAAVATREGWQRSAEQPASLLNDALIATSCRERGISLITNDTDFLRFDPFLKGWRHFRPWPDVK